MVLEEEPRYLDGPKLTTWLVEEEGLDLSTLTDSQKRRWRDWALGTRADLYGTVDQILTNNLIAIRLIPDDCWTDEQQYKKAHLCSAKEARLRRDEGRLLLSAGVGIKEVARRLGVTQTTVRNWRRKMTEEESSIAA
jgi:hypothetical protein